VATVLRQPIDLNSCIKIGGGAVFLLAVSVLLYSLSCVVLVRISRRLNVENYLVPIVLVFRLLPSALLLGSVALREGWELLIPWALRRAAGRGITAVSPRAWQGVFDTLSYQVSTAQRWR